MNKEQILNTDSWKYISSLNPKERHSALFGKSQALIENNYLVKIETWPYTKLSDVKDNMIAIAVTDNFKNQSELAVLIPI